MSLRGLVRAGGVAVCLSMAMPTSPAGAQPAPAPSPPTGSEPAAPDKKTAGERFREAEAAFLAGDFVRAGGLFEEANRLAPHPSALWNAARAWQRAATRARHEPLLLPRRAPADAPDRAAAAARWASCDRAWRAWRCARTSDRRHVDERPVTGATCG